MQNQLLPGPYFATLRKRIYQFAQKELIRYNCNLISKEVQLLPIRRSVSNENIFPFDNITENGKEIL